MARNPEFNSIQVPNPTGAVHDLTHDVKISFRSGHLIPTLLLDCLPGDKWKIGQENMMRLQPMLAPVMHRVYINTHYFFVPNRLLWEDWDTWITGQNDELIPPYMDATSGDITVGSLLEYLGLPLLAQATFDLIRPSAFPRAAYLLIYNEYYRDQNVTGEVGYLLSDGANPIALGESTLERAWMHDYFTSALPWAQKGDAVQIPIADIPTLVTNVRDGGSSHLGNPRYRRQNNGNPVSTDVVFDITNAHLEDSLSATQLWYEPNGSLEVDIQDNAGTINSLRRAIALQEWLEKNARGGTRYSEHIWSHFHVRSSDARLGRPEYLGGTNQNMVISEVLSTAETVDSEDDIQNVVGQMAGHGISIGSDYPVRYFCEEHGWILGITSVMPRTAYEQGVPRKWTRETPLDYAWPSFAHIGEQEILNKEIYTVGLNATQLNGTFGYIPRYSEYKFESDRVAGLFRTDLDYWHMGRKFSALPTLSSEFIQFSAGIPTRVFAVEIEVTGQIMAHIINKCKVYRKLPKFSTPMI